MPASRALLIYARLRSKTRMIHAWLRPFKQFMLSLRKQWPVTCVWVGLCLCFLLPGLASRQTSEALFEYGGTHNSASGLWGRFAITSLIMVALSAVLAHWSYQLVHRAGSKEPPDIATRIVCIISIWLPPIALSDALLSLQETGSEPDSYRLMALGIITAPVAYHWLFRACRKLLARISSRQSWRVLSNGGSLVILIIAAAFVLLFGTADKDRTFGVPISSIQLAQAVGSVNFVLLSFATFAALGSMLVVAGRFFRIPLAAIVLITAFAFGWFDLNDNHAIRHAREVVNEHPEDVENAFNRWMRQRPDKHRFSEYPVMLVSAEGGGIRAAFFTAITLARLVDRCPGIASHIFAISGVSGGAVGAAVFAAAMKAKPPDLANKKCDLKESAPPVYERAVASVLSDDFLSPILARALFSDALQQFLPFPVFAFDRQLGFEFGLERAFQRQFGQDVLAGSIYNLQPSESNPAIPYLLLNSTEVDGGRRFVMTPLYLRTEEFGASEDWHWLDWKKGPPISSAATTSARFPILSPAGYAYNNGRKTRYVDGGYIDNSGSVSLEELFVALYRLREEKYLQQEKDSKKSSTLFAMFALHIGNAPLCNIIDKEKKCEDIDAVPPSAGGLGELLSPLNTVINARSAQVDYNLRRFHTEIDRGTQFGRFDFHGRVQMYDRGVPVPLGWLLSRRVASELRAQLDRESRQGDCKAKDPYVHSNYCELQDVAGMMTWTDD